MKALPYLILCLLISASYGQVVGSGGGGNDAVDGFEKPKDNKLDVVINDEAKRSLLCKTSLDRILVIITKTKRDKYGSSRADAYKKITNYFVKSSVYLLSRRINTDSDVQASCNNNSSNELVVEESKTKELLSHFKAYKVNSCSEYLSYLGFFDVSRVDDYITILERLIKIEDGL